MKKKFWLGIWIALETLCLVGVILFGIFAFIILMILMLKYGLHVNFVKVISISTFIWIISRLIRSLIKNKK